MMLTMFSTILVAAVIFAGGVTAKQDQKFIGGTVKVRDHPYVVSLFERLSFFCGGAIVGDRHIVTAAQCTDGKQAKNLEVRISSDKNWTGSKYKVIKIVQHNGFDKKTLDNDISVLILETNIDFGRTAQPIALPKFNEHFPVGFDAFMAAFGINPDDKFKIGSSDIIGAVLPIISNGNCQAAHKKREVTDNMLCTSYLTVKGKNGCVDRPGGSLVLNDKLIGIVSWGNNCGDHDYPGVYTNVAKYTQFIQHCLDM